MLNAHQTPFTLNAADMGLSSNINPDEQQKSVQILHPQKILDLWNNPDYMQKIKPAFITLGRVHIFLGHRTWDR